MSFCTKCGHPLASSSRFCTGCGAPRTANREELPAYQTRPRRLPGGRATAAAIAAMALTLSALLAWRLTGPWSDAQASAGPSRPPASTVNDRTPSSALPASPTASTFAPAASDDPIRPVTAGQSAAQQASTGQVAAFLGTYFAAINHRDYQAYISLFDDPARPFRNEQQFLSGYQTTTDSDPTLVALAPASMGEWAATVTFISHQSPADSATRSSCTSWDTTLYLEPRGNSYLIELPPPGYRPSRVAC
jgi:zinc-ribbon domain